ncbi:MAG: ATP-dependent RecD-like DNA helicase [Candidatus Babeliales bacterium]
MSATETLTGYIDRLLFHNQENGFVVFILQLQNKQTITVKGFMPSLHPGEQVSIQGSWIMHPKFGKQFEAQQCTTQVPTSIIGLKKYLGSGLIKGIGPTYGEKLVNRFGEQVLEVIDKQPERLQEIDGIGPKRVEKIIEAWKDQKEISHLMVFLQEKGVTPAYAAKIYKHYRANAINVILENPYRLAQDIWGIGFKTADQIAQNLSIASNSIKRIKAGILHIISTTVNDGSLYSPLEALKKETATLLDLALVDIQDTIKVSLHELYNSDIIKLITYNDQHFITLSQFYFSEKGVAHKIKKVMQQPPKHIFDINTIYKKLRNAQEKNIVLNEDQQRSILTSLQHKISIITGGPGTGKTTLIKKLLSILDDHKVVYRLAAPTGRAAKRITEGTGRPATTIHRLLEFDVSTMGFVRNEQNALQLDFLIIDEASMIDIFLAYAVLKALPLNASLVLIGDTDQLPSVGAGNFLQDLIASKSVGYMRLTKIFRQAQDSLIVINAHRVNEGQFPLSFKEDARRDFIFIKEEEPGNVPTHLQIIYTKALGRVGVSPADSMVLVPMHRGVIGTQNLNHHLQQLRNPQQTEEQVLHAGTTFKVGDPVMQMRNNYDKLIFNGDIGTITTINKQEKILQMQCLGRILNYDFSELNELALAYAISIHKSQGSEYEAVIIPIFMQHFTLLQCNLIYTAITRAKKLCIIIGQPKAIMIGIKNKKNAERITFLQQFLTTDLQCR